MPSKLAVLDSPNRADRIDSDFVSLYHDSQANNRKSNRLPLIIFHPQHHQWSTHISDAQGRLVVDPCD